MERTTTDKKRRRNAEGLRFWNTPNDDNPADVVPGTLLNVRMKVVRNHKNTFE
jgi:hypothetical protein